MSEILEWNRSVKHWWNDWQRQTKRSEEKLVLVPLCAPQIPKYYTFLPVMRQLNVLTSTSQSSTKCKFDAAYLPAIRVLLVLWLLQTHQSFWVLLSKWQKNFGDFPFCLSCLLPCVKNFLSQNYELHLPLLPTNVSKFIMKSLHSFLSFANGKAHPAQTPQ